MVTKGVLLMLVEVKGKAKEASNSNPYLAAPLHFGEKEVHVSPVPYG